MPRVTNGYGQIEIVVTPDTDRICWSSTSTTTAASSPTGATGRRIDVEPSFLGYSIGKWIDTDGDGRYDPLEVETRHFKGPRAYDSSGIPLHKDNQTIVKERISLDKADPNVLHNEVTVIDNALTRPVDGDQAATVASPTTRPFWREVNCAENNNHVQIGKENYMLSADGC